MTLVRDITANYRPDMLELESPNFMGFAHEYHHEKDGVGLNAEDDFLLSLCFCDHCTARAEKAGVPVEGARKTVARFIAELCERAVPERQFPDFPEAGIEAFRAHPELHAFLAWRSEPVTSLIGEIRAAADPATRIVLIDLKDGWLGGVDLAAVGRLCDGAILCCYDMTPEAVGEVIRTGRTLLGPDKFLGLGLRVFYPEVDGPEILTARVKNAVEAGVEEIVHVAVGEEFLAFDDLDLRLDRPQPRGHHADLRFAVGAVERVDLAVGVGDAEVVGVDQGHAADAAAREAFRGPAADAADADHGDFRPAEAFQRGQAVEASDAGKAVEVGVAHAAIVGLPARIPRVRSIIRSGRRRSS